VLPHARCWPLPVSMGEGGTATWQRRASGRGRVRASARRMRPPCGDVPRRRKDRRTILLAAIRL
jgi:hypothetical protein